MEKSNVSLLKMGGSLITYKKNEIMIDQYLEIIDGFIDGTKKIKDLREKGY